MKNYLTFLFLFINSSFLFAQNHFLPGFIITNNQDTIKGLVDYRGNVFNCEVCRFKTDYEGEVNTYYPGDIYAYMITDERFYCTKQIGFDSLKALVFAEYIVNGIVDLYYYVNRDSGFYMIEKEGLPLTQLKTEKKQIQLKEKTGDYVFEYKKYIGKLKYIFNQCPNLFPEIDKVTLSHKSLSDITKKYHDYICDDQQCVVYIKKNKVKLNVAVSAGICYSWINVTNKFYYTGDYNKSTSPTIGISANLTSSRINEKFSLSLLADFGKINYSCYDEYNDNGWAVFKTCKINAYPFDIYSGLKYTYPKGKFRFTIFAGGGFRNLLGLETSHINKYIKDDEEVEVSYDYITVDNFMPGLAATVGFDYFKNDKNRAEFKLTLKRFNIFNKIPTITNHSVNFSVGYYL